MRELIGIQGGRLNLNLALLESLCQQAGDRPIAVVSTIGKFRQGKTLWANMLLRGLQNPDSERIRFDDDDMIGGEGNIPFKSGMQGDTKGIVVWPELFARRDDQGNEIAVMLIDVQGTFDIGNDLSETAPLVVIVSLLSSALVYNVKGNMDLADLQALTIFFQFAQHYGANRPNAGPFGQHFLILSRDSQLEGSHPEYLEDLRRQSQGHPENHHSLASVFASFGRVDSYHVPQAPRRVNEATMQIRAGDCDQDFVKNLCSAAEHILNTLKARRMCDEQLNANKLRTFLVEITRHLNANRLDLISLNRGFANYRVDQNRRQAMQVFQKNLDQLTSARNGQPIEPVYYHMKLNRFKDLAVESYTSSPLFYGTEEEKTNELNAFKFHLQEIVNEKIESNKRNYDHIILEKSYQFKLLLMGLFLIFIILSPMGASKQMMRFPKDNMEAGGVSIAYLSAWIEKMIKFVMDNMSFVRVTLTDLFAWIQQMIQFVKDHILTDLKAWIEQIIEFVKQKM